jgi:hypothetical protein
MATVVHSHKVHSHKASLCGEALCGRVLEAESPLDMRKFTGRDRLTGCGPLADLLDRGGGAATDDDGER